ncbi:MAG: malectin domain-containing carbohydrate-binding protein, partial [Chthoniobacteraceae bacterium]
SQEKVAGKVKHWDREQAVAKSSDDGATKALSAGGGVGRGYAVVMGTGDPGFLETLAQRSQFKILALAADRADVQAARQRLVAARLYGDRVAVRQLTPAAWGLPPYFANLIVIAPDATLPDAAALEKMYAWLRPYGGRLVGPAALLKIAASARLPRAILKEDANGLATITREGALEGSTNYNGDWSSSEDALVKAPLGVLWFDDTLGHFKRSPQPRFLDSVMVTSDKDWLDASTRKGKVDYRLLPPVFNDVYTGRVFAAFEATDLRARFSNVDLETVQQSQYRPPEQKDDWKPGAPKAGMRHNPLTGESELRVFPKSYGCDGGFDYGLIYTMRSGTAAFYDKRLDSGTIHISGPRSGCTNSIVPANGILNVPYFFEGCTCSYPLPMALALVHLPQTFEQWTAWGAVPTAALTGKIERLGVNFGAPGDRKTDDGTLWLDYPSVGGPSPEIAIRTVPAKPETYYHHSVWIEGGEGWPWVAASGCKGLRSVAVSGLKVGSYVVRLVFAEPDAATVRGGRRFDVRVQDQVALENFDVLADTGGTMRVATKTIPKVGVNDGALTITLTPRAGATILSGIEIIREGLPIAPLPSPARVPGRL